MKEISCCTYHANGGKAPHCDSRMPSKGRKGRKCVACGGKGKTGSGEPCGACNGSGRVFPEIKKRTPAAPPPAVETSVPVPAEAWDRSTSGVFYVGTEGQEVAIVKLSSALRYIARLPEVGGHLRRAETEESALLTKLRDVLRDLARLREREAESAALLWTADEIAEAKRAAAEANA